MSRAVDFRCFAREEADRVSLYMQVEGMHCASCAWKIEQSLQAHPGVEARVNFSTQRLRISWPKTLDAGAANDNANQFADEVEALGFHVAPFDAESRLQASKAEERDLLSCLAVAGFATCAIMLFVDPLWFLPARAVTGATRDLMYWMMSLIALPATIWSGRPFFRSAWQALTHGRTNMDVPISLAVIMANALSVYETVTHGRYVYFDASIMLLFFLLIGRYLDLKARGKAREAAEGLLAMLEGTATVVDGERTVSVRIRDLAPGQHLLVAAGEKIAADGLILTGESDIDTQLVTGETLPRTAGPGERLYAGMINRSAPLLIEVSAAADDSLLSEIVGLMEKAERSQGPYVRLADRLAGLYAPVVHGLALATFVGWMIYGALHGAMIWEDALLKAVAVLIITCPCAIGLAVPVVHVLASSRLFKRGILLKSAKGLEAMARIDRVVFDKTGTLTEGTPRWMNPDVLTGENRRIAIAMARQSQHPLSQAIARGGAIGEVPGMVVTDHPGKGLKAVVGKDLVWMGKASWLGVPASGDAQMELWFQRAQGPAIRLLFADAVRADARQVIVGLRARGLTLSMLSGDRDQVAQKVAMDLGISDVRSGLSPVDKVAAVEAMMAEGHRVLMVGDGLNDAAALSAASVSMSPASGVDVTQTAADFVYRDQGLSPILTTYDTARAAQRLVRQNVWISLAYNLIAVPVAVLGLATPLIAAVAMSTSSLVVVLNALRLGRVSRL
ncbi:heavy metal translocating P-type ATPase [Asticcacaulis sp. 201]|uniref:heavy metal translocating P-type ATPase n=1 Tax=Asticcacaulis sp. 201 TaxID=3028787 RepID=UPI0029162EBC|nr:heavy metal translocating P-type ATPase [Asticcacaulis sp. 201]MDV6331125.1 heavy metal translocating P-type ATPase [Asticcacaulis sp. 201]